VLCLGRAAAAQDLVQILQGQITNHRALPLAGATVLVRQDQQTLATAVSDSTGRFILRLAPGRYLLNFSFVGHTPQEQEWLVIAGKESTIHVTLHEQPFQLGEVQITASPVSEAPAGGVQLTVEKSLRVPANFFDPLRMAVSTPGVVAMNDQGNVISVKGYSPNAMLWRVQGLDVLNPNHLANAGTLSDRPVSFGGSVSVLSAQVLDNTQFFTGAFPAFIGNALSAAVDMRLREGNKNKHEFTAQASVIGLDLAAEGPLSKKKNSSFLANYRYSTVGLLAGLGLNFGDEQINFQDFSFHGHVRHARAETSFFGFGGLSSNRFARKPETEWKTEKDRYDINFDGSVGGLGVTHRWGRLWRWEFGSALSTQTQNRFSKSAEIGQPHINAETFEQTQWLLTNKLVVRRNWKRQQLEAGVQSNSQSGTLNVQTVVPLYFSLGFPNFSGRMTGSLIQPFVQFSHRVSKKWELQTGLRAPFFTYNGTHAWEPRIALQRFLPNGSLHVSYNEVSQMQSVQMYIQPGNRNLALTRAAQWLAEWRTSWRATQFSAQAFYHQLRDVPIATDGSLFSAINQFDEFAPAGLVSEGRGTNVGVAASMERKFSNSFYYAINGTGYQSTFTDIRQVAYTSRFSGRYAFNLLAGKEWGHAARTFGVHIRFLYFGGLRQQPIDVLVSQLYGTTLFDTSRGYVVPLPDYWRPDLRISWRKNKPNYTRTLSLDIQNVANHQNVAFTYYDSFLQRVETRYQLGIIPVIVYRVDF
jgi:hypothetical protein